MKTEQEYINDLTQIRQMMERSTKFFTLTGWSGIMAGIYTLLGVYLSYTFFPAETAKFNEAVAQPVTGNIFNLILLALIILILAIGTAIFLSVKKAEKTDETLWNPTAKRFVINMAIPLLTGGIFMMIMISQGMLGLVIPLSLIFYGLALVNASKLTFDEVRYLGIAEIMLGLISLNFISFNLIFWAIGFGLLHIIYGIYMHWRYEK